MVAFSFLLVSHRLFLSATHSLLFDICKRSRIWDEIIMNDTGVTRGAVDLPLAYAASSSSSESVSSSKALFSNIAGFLSSLDTSSFSLYLFKTSFSLTTSASPNCSNSLHFFSSKYSNLIFSSSLRTFLTPVWTSSASYMASCIMDRTSFLAWSFRSVNLSIYFLIRAFTSPSLLMRRWRASTTTCILTLSSTLGLIQLSTLPRIELWFKDESIELRWELRCELRCFLAQSI